jgi:hypothetical protein
MRCIVGINHAYIGKHPHKNLEQAVISVLGHPMSAVLGFGCDAACKFSLQIQLLADENYLSVQTFVFVIVSWKLQFQSGGQRWRRIAMNTLQVLVRGGA